MSAVARTVRTAALLALGALASGCSLLPDDHLGREFVERPFRALRRDAERFGASVESGVTRGITATAATVRELPEQALERVGDTDRAVRREGSRLLATAEQFPARAAVKARRIVATATTDLDRTARPFDRPYDPFAVERTISDARRSLASAPHTLRLDRTPWADATDPGREIEIEPAGRRHTWIERIVGRIRL